MIREFLFALLGKYGGIFSFEGHVKISQYIPIHDSEKAIILKYCSLSTFYLKALAFIDKNFSLDNLVYYNFSLNGLDLCYNRGIYIASFCNSLDVFLDTYRKSIIEIDEIVDADDQIELIQILCKLDKFFSAFDIINKIIDGIENDKVLYTNIIDKLVSEQYSGISENFDLFNGIISGIHQVVLRQIAMWMFYGTVNDNYNEFFIKFENNKYSLAIERVPNFFKIDTIKCIYHVGNMVNVFFNRDKLTKLIKNDSNMHQFKKWRNDSYEKLSLCTNLNLIQFDDTINNIKSAISSILYNFINQNDNLFNYFKEMRKYYLLSDGIFFTELISQGSDLLSKNYYENMEKDVNKRLSIRGLIGPENDYCIDETLRISIDQNEAFSIGWNIMSLDINISDSLKVIHNENIEALYKKIFKHFLFIVRIMQNLKKAWFLNKHRCAKLTLQFMNMFVNSLYYYIQYDVVNGEYKKLISNIKNTDIDNITNFHEHCLLNISQLSFIKNEIISESLISLLNQSMQFSTYILNTNSSNQDYVEENYHVKFS
ncbi:Gamma-ring complex protein [Intoshia linei]|uniref:Gamma-tubulin complex component n=1 Tax=Intoshia linei TaxID=1819745 RepID=A0A177B3P4_9BILA|nr:Gamma-ring complex protein [Intoshia linei]